MAFSVQAQKELDERYAKAKKLRALLAEEIDAIDKALTFVKRQGAAQVTQE